MTKKEVISKESVKNKQDVEDILAYLSLTNDPNYTKLKLLEELSELSEVILKSINKHPDRKPSQESINEEIGDVIMRIDLYMRQESIKRNIISERITTKCNKFLGFIKENKYNKGI